MGLKISHVCKTHQRKSFDHQLWISEIYCVSGKAGQANHEGRAWVTWKRAQSFAQTRWMWSRNHPTKQKPRLQRIHSVSVLSSSRYHRTPSEVPCPCPDSSEMLGWHRMNQYTLGRVSPLKLSLSYVLDTCRIINDFKPNPSSGSNECLNTLLNPSFWLLLYDLLRLVFFILFWSPLKRRPKKNDNRRGLEPWNSLELCGEYTPEVIYPIRGFEYHEILLLWSKKRDVFFLKINASQWKEYRHSNTLINAYNYKWISIYQWIKWSWNLFYFKANEYRSKTSWFLLNVQWLTTAVLRWNTYTSSQRLFSSIEIQCTHIQNQNEVAPANSFIIQEDL